MRLKGLILCSFLLPVMFFAQKDTLQLKNKNVLVGEIKSFSKGVLIMETPYSDSDFKIKFSKIKALAIQRKSLVILTNNRRRFGNVRTNEKGKVVIKLEDGQLEEFELHEIIALDEIEDKFWDRFSGSIDFGFNLSKANALVQFTTGGEINYTSKLWIIDGSINVLNHLQNDSPKNKRADAKLEFYRILPKNWYLLGNVSFLSNTEQALDGRISPSIGAGKFLLSTNKLYLGLGLGLTYNIEYYADRSLNKTSSEAFLSFAFNMFDFEDIDLSSGIDFYPSLSEGGRIRTDYDLNVKFDFFSDFYFKLGFTLNFDNQPVVEGNNLDYIVFSGFGWEFD